MFKITRIKNYKPETIREVNRLMSQIGLTKHRLKPLTEKVFKSLIGQKGVMLFGACSDREMGSKLFGIVTIYFVRVPSGLTAFVEDLVIDEPYREWGVGRVLLEHCVNLARQKKARHINLRTNPVRVEANKLYQAAGFNLMKTNFYRINLFK